MLSVSSAARAWPKVVMLDLPPDSPAERKRLGKALALLRDDAGLTQPEAADACEGISLTAWQNYEYGRRRFSPDLVRRVTAALGRDEEDLMLARAKVPAVDPANDDGRAVQKPGRLFELPLAGHASIREDGPQIQAGDNAGSISLEEYFTGEWKVLQVVDGRMAPYVSPGGFVTYNPKRFPQPGQGCVVETMTGEMHVRRFVEMAGGQLRVEILHPKAEAASLPLTSIKGVYLVGLRQG